MPPVVIAAGIGAAAGIGGAVMSSSAQKKAANKASATALTTANQNNALQREIYGKNEATLSPFVNRGNEAGNAINSLLGLGGAPQATQQFGQPVAAMDYGGSDNPDGRFAAEPQVTALTQAPVAGGPSPYQNAFKAYQDSTGFQFQMDQGNKAINQGYAAKGTLQSGAALKALQTYGQNTATGFFKDYLGLLSNQQGVGLSGASAIAGVGQGYANSVSNNNNNAANQAIQGFGTAANANSQTYGAIAGGVAGMANAFGSSYGARPAAAPAMQAPVVNYNALGRSSAGYFG